MSYPNEPDAVNPDASNPESTQEPVPDTEREQANDEPEPKGEDRSDDDQEREPENSGREPAPAEGIEQIEDDELRKLVPNEGAQFQDASFTTDGAPERTGMDEDFDSLSKHRRDETLKAYEAPLNSVRASSDVYVGARTLEAMSIGFSQLSVLWIPWASFIFNYWGAFNPYFNGTENLRVRQYL